MKNIKNNITMLMDFYELTMANGYLLNNSQDDIAVFDLFYRKNPDKASFSIACGLQQVIEYIQDLYFSEDDIKYLKELNIFNTDFLNYLKDFKFTGNIYAIKEGTIVYPNTPLITVEAPILQAQLIETALLLIINHQTLIASKTNRIVRAACDSTIFEFGARRAHSFDAAIYGARAAYIGGVSGTATVLAGKMFNIPLIGTMAHSWIQYFDDEYLAFKKYAEAYPSNCVLLIDTYNVLKSGIINAIKVHNDILVPLGYKLKGIRIDSGDLAYLSKKVRKILDENNLKDTKIIVSNSVDEELIHSLRIQQAPIDSYGVGERLITSKSEPVFGGVYKLVSLKQDNKYIPKIKISESIEKITNPSFKKLYRVYNSDNKGRFDILALHDEIVNENTIFKNELKPYKNYTLGSNSTIKLLTTQIFKDGNLIYDIPSINEIKEYFNTQINSVFEEEKRFYYPQKHPVDLTEDLYKLKVSLLKEYE